MSQPRQLKVIPTSREFKIIALISAHNEGDVIHHVIGDLLQQGIEVYLINHCSTDNTVAEAARWLGQGVIAIENFPQDAGYSSRNASEYLWSDILRRKQELAQQLAADWFIHHDADEFRESPWPELDLRAGIRLADAKGYNAIDFELLNFRPVDDHFVPGSDVRAALPFYEEAGSSMGPQVKAWKNLGRPVDLVSSGGHEVQFEGKVVCPVKFILRHYPIRSQAHGVRKVLAERKKRFNAREKRAFGWHTHYDSVQGDNHRFLHARETLHRFDPVACRARLIGPLLPEELATAVIAPPSGAAHDLEAETGPVKDTEAAMQPSSVLLKEALFCFHDLLDYLSGAITALKKGFGRHR